MSAAVVMTHAKNRSAADNNPEAWEEDGVGGRVLVRLWFLRVGGGRGFGFPL